MPYHMDSVPESGNREGIPTLENERKVGGNNTNFELSYENTMNRHMSEDEAERPDGSCGKMQRKFLAVSDAFLMPGLLFCLSKSGRSR